MKVMFVVGESYLPQMTGGAQSTVHELALDGRAMGHDVCVLAGLSTVGFIGFRNRALMKLTGRKIVTDQFMSYPTYRKWRTWEDVDASIEAIRPDVAVLQIGQPVQTARQLAWRKVGVVFYFQDVEFHDLGGDPSTVAPAAYISNSEYTAKRVREAYGVDSEIIRPLIHAERYTVNESERSPEVVTFINPIALKGRDLAFEIAKRCPDIPFEFVEGWPLGPSEWRELRWRVRDEASNVTLRRRTRDMTQVYKRSKILLVPSRWEEAWGRVASEAHLNGVPVVGSRRGGLPEAIGPGGIVLDFEAPADDWATAIQRLWRDEALHRKYAEAALAYARRPELDRALQAKAFFDVVAKAAQAHQT